MNDTRTAADTRRLGELLAAYGRNPARWPQADRARFAATLSDPARLPAGEAEAAFELDCLLDRVAAPAVPEGAAERLLARLDRETATVHRFPARPAPPRRWWTNAAAAGALAASLVVGVYLGASGRADGLIEPVFGPVDIAGLADDSDDTGYDLGGEDLL